MRIAIAAWQDRVAPALDWTRRILLLQVDNGRERQRKEYSLSGGDLWSRARQLLELELDVLICGAISGPLENALSLAGVRVHAFVCGPVE
ncbi:MAG: NifB/NifX family molybdenum-iron cluster-binding protein, partial [Bryobacteraceae bacterium]